MKLVVVGGSRADDPEQRGPVAGVGNDSRNRSFDVVSQARRYDPDAEYVSRWVPELAPLPPDRAHEPWRLSAAERAEYDPDYPEPVVDPESL